MYLRNRFLSFFVLFMLTCGVLLASETWINISGDNPAEPEIYLQSSSGSAVSYSVENFGFYSEDISTKYQVYKRLRIPSAIKTSETGKPELPIIRRIIAIPECSDIDLQSYVVNQSYLEDYTIYPVPELQTFTNQNGDTYLGEVFSLDKNTYNADEFYPQSECEIVQTGYIRGQKVAEVYFYPFQINPVSKQLRVNSFANISLSFAGASTNVNIDTGIFNNLCSNILLNYQSSGLSAGINTGASQSGSVTWMEINDESGNITADYIIILADEFFDINNPNADIQALADHRADYNGFDVVVVNAMDIFNTYSYINFDYKDEQQIRNFLKSVYDNGTANHSMDGRLAYALLVGHAVAGAEYQPMPGAYDNPLEEPTDYYYSCLTTVAENDFDDYGELFVGRFSVETAGELSAIVQKTLDFENDQYSGAWRDNMLLSAGVDDYGDPVVYNYEAFLDDSAPVVDLLTEHNINFNEVNMIDYQNNNGYPLPALAQSATVNYINNQGCLITSYWNHGSLTDWYTLRSNNLTDLTNEHRPGIYFSIACLTGYFDHPSTICMAERFTNAADKGAVVFIGAPRLTYLLPSTNISHFMFDAMLNNGEIIGGESYLSSKIRSVRRFDYNYFGDPALNFMFSRVDMAYTDLVLNQEDVTIPEGFYTPNSDIPINVRIINNSSVAANSVDVSFFIDDPEEGPATNLETITINQIDAYSAYELTYNFPAGTIPVDYYNVYAIVDYNNTITERCETNNKAKARIEYFNFKEDFPRSIGAGMNAYPTVYNVSEFHQGKEIIIGQDIYSSSGDVITSSTQTFNGWNSLGNIYNSNDLYSIAYSSNDNELHCMDMQGNEIWSWAPDNENLLNLCIDDLNYDGYEEILGVREYELNNVKKYNLWCLNHSGELMWDIGFERNEILMALPMQMGTTRNKEIILVLKDGLYKSDINGDNISLMYYSGCELLDNAIASDVDYDGNMDVFVSKVATNGDLILVHYEAGLTNEYFIGNLGSVDLPLLRDRSPIANIIVTDLNSDGTDDIIVSTLAGGRGIYVFNGVDMSYGFLDLSGEENQLNSLSLVSGDMTNDGNIEIGCIVNSQGDRYFTVINAALSIVYTTPIYFTGPAGNLKLNDIDLDGVLELVYNSSGNLVVLDLPVSGKGVVWEGDRGNKRNSSVFRQTAFPFEDNSSYIWSNNIALTDRYRIPNFKILTIKPGTSIYSSSDECLQVFGDLNANGNSTNLICFMPNTYWDETDTWGGIELYEDGYRNIEYCQINNASIGFNVKNGAHFDHFRNNTISNCNTGFLANGDSPQGRTIKSNTFLNNTSGVELLYIGNETVFTLEDNTITGLGATNGSYHGIHLWCCGRGMLIVSNNISQNDKGIRVHDCKGFYVTHDQEHSRSISGNNVGMHIYDSYGQIDGANISHNNHIGIEFLNNSYPQLENSYVSYNSTYNLYCNYGYPEMRNGHNDIIQDPNSFTAYCDYTPSSLEIRCEQNWWGNYPPRASQFFPSRMWLYSPADQDNNWPENILLEGAALLFSEAKTSEETGDYTDATNTYRTIIEEYPDTEETVYSLKRLLSCEKSAGMDLHDLKNYFTTHASNNANNPLLFMLNRNLSIECLIEMGMYEEALNAYDEILDSTFLDLTDSVFTAINVMSTFIIMDNNGNRISTDDFSKRTLLLKPDNLKDFIDKKSGLLSKISKDYNDTYILKAIQKEFIISNYPNPFNPITNISFNLPETGKVKLNVYNIKGQLVKTLVNEEMDAGSHSVVWNGKNSGNTDVSSGIYFYRIEAEGQEPLTRKMILMK